MSKASGERRIAGIENRESRVRKARSENSQNSQIIRRVSSWVCEGGQRPEDWYGGFEIFNKYL